VKEWPGNDPNAAWASTNSDPESLEWERARKVREALGISIDRQLFVDTLLGGAGDPGIMWGWMGHESKLPPDMKWVFDPARARQLVKDAGYPDGFDITLTLNIRNNPAEKEQCEATAGMWRDIGLNVSYETPPYDTITRPKLLDRSYSGAICHGTRFYVEPIFIIGIIHLSSSGVNLGVEHEIMDAFVAKINSTFDPEERWKVMLEMGQWQWDNAFNISIFNVHQEYPIGPKLDPWTEHMEKGSTYTLGDLEWTPHSK
jgi:peptide/nickel transport system substrate-binding protein